MPVLLSFCVYIARCYCHDLTPHLAIPIPRMAVSGRRSAEMKDSRSSSLISQQINEDSRVLFMVINRFLERVAYSLHLKADSHVYEH